MKSEPEDFAPDEIEVLHQLRQRVPQASRCPAPELLSAAAEDALPEEQLASVKQHLMGCGACRVLSQSLQQFSAAGPTDLQERRIRARIGLPVATVAPSPQQSPRWKAPWWAILCAGAALAALTIVVFQPGATTSKSKMADRVDPVPSPQAPGAEPLRTARVVLQPAPLRLSLSQLTWRGEDPNDSGEAYLAALGEALKPYRESHWVEAATALEKLSARYPRAPEPVFFRGVALLMAGEPQAAAAVFDNARTFSGAAFTPDLPWYRSIALDRAGKWDQAKPLLDALCASPGPYQKQACAVVR